ncbi:MAG TPA: hypothetical protein VFE13_16675 [Caulobacteraceae bacterium]|jgi:hypothetical protein|nr:hypothetical protein [Caulobacteraceae bacterium]
MSNRQTYHQQALDTLERAMRTHGLARDCLMQEALRLHRLAREGGEMRGEMRSGELATDGAREALVGTIE